MLGFLQRLKSRSELPITLEDTKTVNQWNPDFKKSGVKKCNTRDPRYVVTDSAQDRYAVYTDSLSTCLGVLLYENSGGDSIAGLAHVMPTEKDLAARLLKEVDYRYSPSRLNVVIAVGDDPDPDTFRNTVRTLLKADNISKNRFRIVYGGTGKPYFMNKIGKGMTSSKIAFNMNLMCFSIGSK